MSEDGVSKHKTFSNLPESNPSESQNPGLVKPSALPYHPEALAKVFLTSMTLFS
jgi:hypothetical protein